MDKQKLADFLAKAQGQECIASLRAQEEGDSGDETDPVERSGTQLRASAVEFVPGAAAASATPATDRVIEVYSVSAQKWCLGLIVGVCPLPGGQAALTLRYEVREGQWNEKLLYDQDPNIRRRRHVDGAERDGSTDLWNQFKEQHQDVAGESELRADAPVFVPGSQIPSPLPNPHGSPYPQGMPVPHPHGPPMSIGPAPQLRVTVPPGCAPGQHINIVTASGRQLSVQIPPGLLPGQAFLCAEPPAAGPRGYPFLGQRPMGGPMPAQRLPQPGQPMPPAAFVGPRPSVPDQRRSEVTTASQCVIG